MLAEDIKWHQNILFRFQATCIESQVNGLQELGALRERRPGHAQPLRQVKLQQSTGGICEQEIQQTQHLWEEGEVTREVKS